MANLTPAEIEQIQGALLFVSGILPTNVQKYVKDFAIDGPLVFDALGEFKNALAALPPRNVRTAADVAKAFGVPDGTPGYALARLYDAVTAQIEEARNPTPVPLPFAAPALPFVSSANPAAGYVDPVTGVVTPGFNPATGPYDPAFSGSKPVITPVTPTNYTTNAPQGPVK